MQTKKPMAKKAIKNPNDVWAKMKIDFDLDDEDMPEYLKSDIEAWNSDAEKGQLTESQPLPINRPLTRSLQAEGILKMLVSPDYPERPMVAKKCKSCGDVFRTTYASNAYCSDLCRRDGLSSFGIDWHDRYNSKSEVDEWSGRVPPMTIPPAALRVMKFLVREAEEISGVAVEEWRPKYIAQMMGGRPVVLEEQSSPDELIDSVPNPVAPLSLKERLAALKSKTGPGN